MRIAVIASTGGSVYRAACQLPFVRQMVYSVISDRPCPAIDAAYGLGHNPIVLPIKGEAFSDAVLSHLTKNGIDLALSFYTKLFRGAIIDEFFGRLINFHPSILPACPGTDGFGDTLRSGARFIGSTVHLVDRGIDTGSPLLQGCLPNDPGKSIEERRHEIFIQQCKSLIQICAWARDERIFLTENGYPRVQGAKYEVGEFSPMLDSKEAIEFTPEPFG